MGHHYKAPAIARATKVIEYIAFAKNPVRLSPLALDLGLSKSSLHGILHTLVEAEWLQKDKHWGFRLHPNILNLFLPLQQNPEIRRVARPFMDYLAEQTTESVFLGQRNATKVVILDCVQGSREMRIGARVGTHIPLLAGAIGKIFLSDLSTSELKKLLAESDLPAFTSRSIRDPEVFAQTVDTVKKQGYALDDEEYLPGVRAVAVPIRQAGRLAAALWIVGFSSRFTDNALIRARSRLVDAGELISRILDQKEKNTEYGKNTPTEKSF